jgi:hypothetical protein
MLPVLRDDALKTELAGVGEDDRAVEARRLNHDEEGCMDPLKVKV